PAKRVPRASSVSRPRLVLATLNPGKVLELTALLAGVPFEVVALAALPGATLPEEGADSYRDNALLKARAVARAEGAWALGDDSGLEVDALGGARAGSRSRRRRKNDASITAAAPCGPPGAFSTGDILPLLAAR